MTQLPWLYSRHQEANTITNVSQHTKLVLGSWKNDNNFYNQEAGKEKLEHCCKKISYLHDPAYQQKIVKRARRCLYSHLGFPTLTWMALLGGNQLASRTLATKEYWKRNFYFSNICMRRILEDWWNEGGAKQTATLTTSAILEQILLISNKGSIRKAF